jgi:hypothetical protein
VKPPSVATSFVPSADEATYSQESSLYAVVSVQVTPESAEVQIPPPLTTATNLVPSDEEATDHHSKSGSGGSELAGVHVAPELLEV